MAFGSSTRKRAFIGSCIGLMVVGLLGGCSMKDGLEPLQARDMLVQSTGVEKATVTTGEVAATLKSSYFVDVRVTVRAGSDEADLRALALRAVQIGWATRISHNPNGVRLAVSGVPDIDVKSLLSGEGFKLNGGVKPSDPVLVSGDGLQKKWGDWPGVAPSQG